MDQPKYKFGDTLWYTGASGLMNSIVVNNIGVSGDTYLYNGYIEEGRLFPTQDEIIKALEACRFHKGDVVWVSCVYIPTKATVTQVYQETDCFMVTTDVAGTRHEKDVYASREEVAAVIQKALLERIAYATEDLNECNEALKKLAAAGKEQE